MSLFHIGTVTNDLEQYQEMRASFLEAGFDDANSRFMVFDNSQENRNEPYSAINQALQATHEPYLIFCHQDIRFDQGEGCERLKTLLEDLDRRHPKWAVAGNAGFDRKFKPHVRISYPGNRDTKIGNFPQEVISLDENFLVIKSGTQVYCSEELHGFHLYATDLCLSALKKNRQAYVIDFHLTHLSSGNARTRSFVECREQFLARWRREWNAFLVVTPSTKLFLSRFALLRQLMEPIVSEGGTARIRQRLGSLLKSKRT